MNTILYYSLMLGQTVLYAEDAPAKKNPFDIFPLEEPPPDAAQDSRFLGEFLYMLLMLGLLIGVVMLATYFLKRLTSTRIEALNSTSRIKILESRPLSNRSHVHLIALDDQEYLIVENPTSVSALGCKDNGTSL